MKNEFNIFIRTLALPLFVLATFLFSFSPWIILLVKTPPDHIFSGIHWWDSDYFVYLSFVENGVRGHLDERFLMNSITSYTAWIHGIYTISGYILGFLGGLNSIVIYHIDRFVLGLLFSFLLMFFYQSVFKSKIWTFLGLLFVFWISGFPTTYQMDSPSFSRYLSWIQQLNIFTRATGLPHYLFSFVFFIPAVWVFVSFRGPFMKKIIYLVFLTSVFIYANPVNSLIFYATLSLYLFLTPVVMVLHKTVKQKRFSFRSLVYAVSHMDFVKDVFLTLILFLCNLPLLLYYEKLLTAYPWGEISNVFKFFIGNSLITFSDLFLALGPLALFSFFGIFICLWKVIHSDVQRKWYIVCIAWVIAQSGLFLRGNLLGIEQYRFLQGLYYIPMGVLAVESIRFSGKHLEILSRILFVRISQNIWVGIITGISFLVTLPTLYVSYGQNLYTYSNLSYFQSLYFPTKQQYNAYAFLERNTPFATTVLAGKEASFHIPALSGNANKLDFIDKGDIQKHQFFSNNLSFEKAHEYLTKNNISYIYVGWEERNLGFTGSNNPYLKSIFKNSEVEVYKVLE
ncbi:hypothetical protein HYW55_05720 [Candidatus Gottesmanbacteria bacterium]|nr:hypothetical protein [Candidatus Gottesmanbacteria bacterium]